MTRYLVLARMAALLAASALRAEAPHPASGTSQESVTVTATGPLSDKAIAAFVQSHVTPSQRLGKIARWRNGVCPFTAGLPPEGNLYVSRRIKAIATMVGAPVEAEDACKSNIGIVFTTKPQALLDDIRTRHPFLLGEHDPSQTARLATINRPVQAWYVTETEDMNGARSVDYEPQNNGVDLLDPLCQVGASNGCFTHLPYARESRVEASRLGDGLSSNLFHVTVVVDWNAVQGAEIGPLADYIALLALSEAVLADGCQEVPSIANLMAPDCDAARKPAAITDLDLAYLRGLYRMETAGTLVEQRSQIVYQMKKALDRH
jgi:hypothetical protein